MPDAQSPNDRQSSRDRMIEATLALAGEHDWSDISFAHIAEEAEVSLSEACQNFENREAILKAFSARVDAEVLKQIADEGDETSVARDRLFDTLMTRFEVLTPYKPALRRLSRNSWTDPALTLEMMPSIFNGQRWMLEASGISTGGATGRARVLGTSAIYAQAVRTWLEDDDVGMAKTMAALDSRLRRGEKTMSRIEDTCSLLKGFGNVLFSRRRKTDTAAPQSPANDTSPSSDTMETA